MLDRTGDALFIQFEYNEYFQKCAIMSTRQVLRMFGAVVLLAGLGFGHFQITPSPDPGVYPEAGDRADAVRRLNDLARFCAGLEIDRRSEIYDLTRTDDWTRFAADESARWESFKKPAQTIRAWVKSELSPHKTANPSEFYPFGGPDILFATLMRPSARLYVLVGLEPVGSTPDPKTIRETPLKDFLSQYSVALDDIIRLSFFRRADLVVEMKTPVIDGVLPVIMVLLARTDKEIISVERGLLNTRGEFINGENDPPDPPRKPRALRLKFRDSGRGDERTLIYLSQDLSNPAVDSNRGFLSFVDKSLSRGFGFIKSASYLMHKPVFSSIAGIILRVSDVVLEDDSGMPYRLFDPSVWKISLYGDYGGPIDLFKDFFQKDLLDAATAGTRPLGFHIGYGKKSNLLLAVRKAS
ncbi:MAG: hypothetical protein A2W03_14895 [Candidatus Aminicenantes bacterium RBG_16_63_16]|nr:MAG: hypothetical protein A2W03_14895 [Candidatus Aminicenantes bacterium RBG_16_63_16]